MAAGRITGAELSGLQALGVIATPYAWAAHIVICSTIQAVVALVLRAVRLPHPWALGAALAIGYAWSREKTEFEFILRDQAHASTLGPFWYRGFFPLEWPLSSQVEFYAPTLAVLLIAWAVEAGGRTKETGP